MKNSNQESKDRIESRGKSGGNKKASKANNKANNKGIALVIVLTVMSLATIMIISFISIATSEHESATTYSRGIQAQQVAEQAVNMVIGQIRAATSDPEFTWASQPGVVRTWSANGEFKGYKLYSDDLMIEPNEQMLVEGDFDDSKKTWQDSLDQFVDLNEPVIRGKKVYFPIVDPMAKNTPEWPRNRGGEDDNAGVEGFDFNTGDSDNKMIKDFKMEAGPMDQDVSGAHGTGHLPMPVKWIYQLENGTLGTLDSSNSFVAFDGSSGGVSKDNQIVGRFAFWADDETTKSHLNIHAGGVAWDTPRSGGEADMNMARYQPAQKEWQRYAGHPATIHLSPVLAPGVIDIMSNPLTAEMIYDIVPRVVGGGSLSGTREAAEPNGLVPDENPLYSSVDEYIMKPDRTINRFPTANGRRLRDEEMIDMLERVRFFLTTSSRSPETTVFNTPRICTWPIYNATSQTDFHRKLTPFDKMMRFCSTIGGRGPGDDEGYEYIFRRENEDSSTHDFQQIQRNQDLYAYLGALTEKSIPGVGESFANKYSQLDRYQILTQMFDYIRCTNLHDDTLFTGRWDDTFVGANTSDHVTFTNPRRDDPNETGIHKGHGQVVPIVIDSPGGPTKGFGRFYTLKNLAFIVIACAKGHRDEVEPGATDIVGLRSRNHLELLCGHPAGPTWQGYSVYRQGNQDRVPDNGGNGSAGSVYSNLPPMHYPLASLRDSNGFMGRFDGNEYKYPNTPLEEILNSPGIEIVQDDFDDAMAELQRVYGADAPDPAQVTLGDVHDRQTSHYPTWLIEWLDNYQYNFFVDDADTDGGTSPPREDIEEQNWRERYLQFALKVLTPNDLEAEVKEKALREWRAVINTIVPAFDPSQWNFNLLYNLVGTFPAMQGDSPMPRLEWWENHVISGSNGSTVGGQRNDLSDFSLENRLSAGQTMMQAMMVFDMFCPSTGYVPINPDMSVHIDMDSSIGFGTTTNTNQSRNGNFLATHSIDGSTRSGDSTEWWYSNRRQSAHHDRHAGGIKPVNYFLSSVSENGYSGGQLRHTPMDPGYGSMSPHNQYHWITIPFVKDQSGGSVADDRLAMTGGNITFSIYAHGDENEQSAPKSSPELVQRIEIEVPGMSNVMIPNLAEGQRGHVNEFGGVTQVQPAVASWSLGREGANPLYASPAGANVRGTALEGDGGGRGVNLNSWRTNGVFHPYDVVQSIGVLHGDTRMTAARTNVPTSGGFGYFGPHYNYNNATNSTGVDNYGRTQSAGRMAHDLGYTMGNRYSGASGKNDADRKLVAGINYNGRDPFTPIGAGITRSMVQRYGDFDSGIGLFIDGPYINKPDEGNTHNLQRNQRPSGAFDPNDWAAQRDFGYYPYFAESWSHEAATPSFFSPNRMIPGPGVFGSMPTGTGSNSPWQTLLFRPNVFGFSGPDGQMPTHPGAAAPHDHYLLDLFWMPVVEPYAISEPLSSAGKVNLNCQILPFRHVKRDSSLRGVLRSEIMMLVPTPGSNRSLYSVDYKHNHGRGRGYHWRDNPTGGALQGKHLRAFIMEELTLRQFYRKFNEGFDTDDGPTLFRVPSQICEVHLVPQQSAERAGRGSGSRDRLETYTPDVTDDGRVPKMESGEFWNDHALIGDNARERPYANIHQRVTTKSNTFKVHYRGEVIKQARLKGRDFSTFDPEMDSVVSSYRGSSIVERYIDPNDSRIPDYATEISRGIAATSKAIGDFYRFRIIQPTRFAP